MHLAAFDLDGALADSEAFDGELYVDALHAVLGVEIEADWSGYRHRTDSGILEEIIDRSRLNADRSSVHLAVRRVFTDLVADYVAARGGLIPEIPGANAFVSQLLRHPRVCVAAATGGWEETANLFRRQPLRQGGEPELGIRLHRDRGARQASTAVSVVISGTSADLEKRLEAIRRESHSMGFSIGSHDATGKVLRAFSVTKPSGRFLELGTGTGIATAWLLAGMSEDSTLDSVDNDAKAQAVARRHLESDNRVTLHLDNAANFLALAPQRSFDFVFADAWPGKFSHLNLALDLLKPGGVYFVDDLLPQPSWPEGHAEKIPPLIRALEEQREFQSVRLDCASGLMILVRVPA